MIGLLARGPALRLYQATLLDLSGRGWFGLRQPGPAGPGDVAGPVMCELAARQPPDELTAYERRALTHVAFRTGARHEVPAPALSDGFQEGEDTFLAGTDVLPAPLDNVTATDRVIERPATDAVSSLDDAYRRAGFLERARSRQARESRAHDDHVHPTVGKCLGPILAPKQLVLCPCERGRRGHQSQEIASICAHGRGPLHVRGLLWCPPGV